MAKKQFTRKPYSKFLYKWSPDDLITKIKRTNNNGDVDKKGYLCSAPPRSQGEDWNTTYVYEKLIVDGKVKRIAYVECDYVR